MLGALVNQLVVRLFNSLVGHFPSLLVDSVDTSLRIEVSPHFHTIPVSVPNSLLVKAATGLVTLDTVPLVTLCSWTLVSVGPSDVFCETQEPGPDILITTRCSTVQLLGRVESEDTSPLIEVTPNFHTIPDSVPNSLLVKASIGLATLDTVPLVTLCSRSSVPVGSFVRDAGAWT